MVSEHSGHLRYDTAPPLLGSMAEGPRQPPERGAHGGAPKWDRKFRQEKSLLGEMYPQPCVRKLRCSDGPGGAVPELEPYGGMLAVAADPPPVAQSLNEVKRKARIAGLRASRREAVGAMALRDDHVNPLSVDLGTKPDAARMRPVHRAVKRLDDQLVHEQAEVDESHLVERLLERPKLLASPPGAFWLQR